MRKLRWRRLVWLIAIPVPYLAAALCLDQHGLAQRPGPGPYDAIIVPGCRVMPSGRASLSLRRRTAHAVRLWREGLAPTMVLTGGVGESPPSEAEAAAAVARELGVPEAALVLEARSTTTEENARFAAERTDARRVLVTTDAYHVFRCGRIFGRYFEEATAVGSKSPPYQRAKGALREVAVVAHAALTGKL